VDYTDASLIYYQQGLNDEEVQERTDATIKFANVSAQSAQTASEQLTSVWNNFDDGSESLEHYVDVMTALGATTASSSQEIAEGLEKFAAISDTVGLSYEYAASALATVTATTRQSADVVGTAFKTLFARVQDLELGETLDDGVTLGTYSQALEKVGVDVLDVNGNLIEMDDILDQLGEKWNQIGEAEKVSLAQTVAGTRQYTQLMALMNNWDFFQENLQTANTAEGTLNKQAEIYAESWEAARDRVTASLEDIYDSLINEDFFIGLDNTLTPILSIVADVIDGMGGMKGTLTVVAALMT
jgi:TP901 family phage tail tape measure protein